MLQNVTKCYFFAQKCWKMLIFWTFWLSDRLAGSGKSHFLDHFLDHFLHVFEQNTKPRRHFGSKKSQKTAKNLHFWRISAP